MKDEMKMVVAVISIGVALMVILMLLLSGADLSGIRITRGIRIG